MNELEFKYDIDERPSSKIETIVLAIQHVFAMFGSTILVPTLIGLDVSTSLVTAGVGTLIYTTVTRAKVPVFIGSSFAYIPILTVLLADGGHNAVAQAVVFVGIFYVLLSILIHIVGTNWIDKVLPPVVIGPVIMIIGLSLAGNAVAQAGFAPAEGSSSFVDIAISMITVLSATLILLIGPKKLKIIPIICGIFIGYISAVVIDLFTAKDVVDTSQILSNGFFSLPELSLPFISYDVSFDPSILFMVIPLVFVTISEHIGDHSVSSSMLNKNFLHDPGLGKTILGDGLATLAAGLLGGPVNTTYAENTGVIMLTRIASVFVIRLAAVFAILIAFIGPVVGFINSIPTQVMGGISILLFGMIAQNGIRLLVNAKIDIANPRNLLLMSVILVIGIGQGAIAFTLGDVNFLFQGTSLAVIMGVVLHLVLPQKEVAYGTKHMHIEE